MMFPNDSGPVYRETLERGFPVEPWNTASNLIFLIIVIYWSLRIYKDRRKYLFLKFAIPILFIGYVGGTLFHGTRSHEIWLLMDWVPIMILCVAASIYYFIRLNAGKLMITMVSVLPFITAFSLQKAPIDPHLRSLIGYATIAVVILFPFVQYMLRYARKQGRILVAALFFFAVAIFFRTIDLKVDQKVFFMGTHWLWHSFGGIAVHFLIMYIFLTDGKPAAITPTQPFD